MDSDVLPFIYATALFTRSLPLSCLNYSFAINVNNNAENVDSDTQVNIY